MSIALAFWIGVFTLWVLQWLYYLQKKSLLKRNTKNLGFTARCGACGYETTLNWCGKAHSFDWKRGESYDHIICPKCQYSYKID